MGVKTPTLLLDADVLIDYYQADLAVLSLISKHVGDVYVVRRTLCEVHGLNVADYERHGLKVIEPETEQLTRASMQRGRGRHEHQEPTGTVSGHVIPRFEG